MPSLTTLSLSGTLLQDALLLFLKANSASLRALELQECQLVGDGMWVELIHEFPKILKLERVLLYSLKDFTSARPGSVYFIRAIDEDEIFHHDKVSAVHSCIMTA